ELQKSLDNQMVYTRWGDSFPVMHLSALVTVPLSFTFTQVVQRQSLTLWYSLAEQAKVRQERLKVLRLEPEALAHAGQQHTQTFVLLPAIASERLPHLTMSLGKGASDDIRTERSDRRSLERTDMQHSLTGISPFPPQHTARALPGTPAG